MSLPVINFFVCGGAGLMCLWALITKRADTAHWQRLFFICLAGLGFTIWLISGMINADAIRVENVIARICVGLGMAFSIAGMIQRDRQILNLKCKNCGENPYAD